MRTVYTTTQLREGHDIARKLMRAFSRDGELGQQVAFSALTAAERDALHAYNELMRLQDAAKAPVVELVPPRTKDPRPPRGIVLQFRGRRAA